MINNVDASAFLESATKQLEEKGKDHDLAQFLAAGIAGVNDSDVEAQATVAKAMVQELELDAPESFKRAVDDPVDHEVTPKPKKDEIWNRGKPHH